MLVKFGLILAGIAIVFCAGFLFHAVWMCWTDDEDYKIDTIYHREGTD
ncbi:MAG: hypothetical protein H0Z35_12470 [Thermoanaerobacteraceae bacterium]|nr:hypothetical protein [Thermoanaerobacteraceae bacterium]